MMGKPAISICEGGKTKAKLLVRVNPQNDYDITV